MSDNGVYRPASDSRVTFFGSGGGLVLSPARFDKAVCFPPVEPSRLRRLAHGLLHDSNRNWSYSPGNQAFAMRDRPHPERGSELNVIWGTVRLIPAQIRAGRPELQVDMSRCVLARYCLHAVPLDTRLRLSQEHSWEPPREPCVFQDEFAVDHHLLNPRWRNERIGVARVVPKACNIQNYDVRYIPCCKRPAVSQTHATGRLTGGLVNDRFNRQPVLEQFCDSARERTNRAWVREIRRM